MDGIAGDRPRRHLDDLALGHAHGQEHVALVGSDRDLGVVDAEVDVAAVEVVVVELFKVAGELLARVLVVAAVPAEPVALGRLPRIGEVFLLEFLVADQVDVADLGRLAFLDRQGHVDAVAVELAHRGGDLDVYLPRSLYWRGSFWLPGLRLWRLKGFPSDRPLSDRTQVGRAAGGERD